MELSAERMFRAPLDCSRLEPVIISIELPSPRVDVPPETDSLSLLILISPPCSAPDFTLTSPATPEVPIPLDTTTSPPWLPIPPWIWTSPPFEETEETVLPPLMIAAAPCCVALCPTLSSIEPALRSVLSPVIKESVPEDKCASPVETDT